MYRLFPARLKLIQAEHTLKALNHEVETTVLEVVRERRVRHLETASELSSNQCGVTWVFHRKQACKHRVVEQHYELFNRSVAAIVAGLAFDNFNAAAERVCSAR